MDCTWKGNPNAISIRYVNNAFIRYEDDMVMARGCRALWILNRNSLSGLKKNAVPPRGFRTNQLYSETKNRSFLFFLIFFFLLPTLRSPELCRWRITFFPTGCGTLRLLFSTRASRWGEGSGDEPWVPSKNSDRNLQDELSGSSFHNPSLRSRMPIRPGSNHTMSSQSEF